MHPSISTSTAPCLKKILALMAEKRAAEVFLAAGSPVIMRVRNDYEVVSAEPLSSDGPIQMLLDVVSSDSMQEFRKSNELNIAIPVQGLGRFRISALRQRGTCTVVVRYIGGAIPSLESLSLPPVLGQAILQKSGLILVVGGNSSGKSTTLASLLEHRNASMRGHILTIEDPIEFLIRNKQSIVSQREIGNDTESLHVALRNAARQGPGVIMIGEIRDREAMNLALAYSQSGHLVLATVHASNCQRAFSRILNFYTPDTRHSVLSDLSLSLNLLLAQRLVPTVDDDLAPACELLVNSKYFADMIEKGDFFGVREAMEKAATKDSYTLESDLARMVQSGRITAANALAHAESPFNLTRRLPVDGAVEMERIRQRTIEAGSPGHAQRPQGQSENNSEADATDKSPLELA